MSEDVAVVEHAVEDGEGDHVVAEDVAHCGTVWLMVGSNLPRS
jgi:hypothetical protein